jgi:hypothetical protein
VEIDSDKIDDAVLALLYFTLHDGDGARAMERLRLGQPEPASRQGLHLRSGRQGEIGGPD